VRRATVQDLAAIAGIQAACPEAAPWEVGDYLSHDCLVAVCSGRIAGFAVGRRLAEDESELLNLAVDPACRRRGLGRRLLAELASMYRGTLWLEVRETNLVARKFYETLGFQEAGRRPQYYRDSGEGAIVMNVHS
jgi:[ribosomal protein S18]-alanine N-acetyltransferase